MVRTWARALDIDWPGITVGSRWYPRRVHNRLTTVTVRRVYRSRDDRPIVQYQSDTARYPQTMHAMVFLQDYQEITVTVQP